jgi:hypothetical protein
MAIHRTKNSIVIDDWTARNGRPRTQRQKMVGSDIKEPCACVWNRTIRTAAGSRDRGKKPPHRGHKIKVKSPMEGSCGSPT